MIESFYVSSFKLFDELTIPKLSRVNLFVGLNNSGKTALLEAIRLFVGGAHPRLIIDMLVDSELSSIYPERNGADIYGLHPVRHFFKNHLLPSPENEKSGFMLGTVDARYQFTVKTHYHSRKDRNGRLMLVRKQSQEFENFPGLNWPGSMEHTEGLIELMELDDFSLKDSKAGPWGMHPVPANNRMVARKWLSNMQLARLWDEVVLTPIADEIIKALKCLEPKIQNISFVEGDYSNKRIPLAKLEGSDARIPLKSMGEGIQHVLQIALSLLNAKDGYLFIDEFENGLHWFVQPDIWRVIFDLAEKLNVQVFATTHSLDCVKSFHLVWQENLESGTFYRLEAGSKAVEYSIEKLKDSLELDVDVR